MCTTVDAIYEHGTLVLNRPLALPDNTPVRVTIETTDADRAEWLKQSEAVLSQTWDNPADDVFNELLTQ